MRRDHEGRGSLGGGWDAGLLTRASGELVERLRVGCRQEEQKQASQQASKVVAIDKADDTTMR